MPKKMFDEQAEDLYLMQYSARKVPTSIVKSSNYSGTNRYEEFDEDESDLEIAQVDQDVQDDKTDKLDLYEPGRYPKKATVKTPQIQVNPFQNTTNLEKAFCTDDEVLVSR